MEEQKFKLFKESFDAKSCQQVVETTLEHLKPNSKSRRMDAREKARKTAYLIECCQQFHLFNLCLPLHLQSGRQLLEKMDSKGGLICNSANFKLFLQHASKNLFPLLEKLVSEKESMDKAMQEFSTGKGIDRESVLLFISCFVLFLESELSAQICIT